MSRSYPHNPNKCAGAAFISFHKRVYAQLSVNYVAPGVRGGRSRCRRRQEAALAQDGHDVVVVQVEHDSQGVAGAGSPPGSGPVEASPQSKKAAWGKVVG